MNKKQPYVLLVILFATVGYIATMLLITNNTVQYATLPKKKAIIVADGMDTLPGHFIEDSITIIQKSTIVKNPKRIIIPKKIDRNHFPVLFHINPSFLVWVMLICCMITIASGSFPVFLFQIIQLQKDFKLSYGQMTTGILCAALLMLFLIFSNAIIKLPGYYRPEKVVSDFHILLKSGTILEIIVGSTVVLVLPCIIMVFLIGVASGSIVVNENAGITAIKSNLLKVNKLNTALNNCLQLLAVIVVFSVLTSNLLGKSIRNTLKIEEMEIYPQEIGYIYGMYFSLFLCIIYIPVYYYIKQSYLKLKRVLEEQDEGAEKEKLLELFGTVKFDNTALDNLKVAFTLLAPLLSSLIPQSFL